MVVCAVLGGAQLFSSGAHHLVGKTGAGVAFLVRSQAASVDTAAVDAAQTVLAIEPLRQEGGFDEMVRGIRGRGVGRRLVLLVMCAIRERRDGDTRGWTVPRILAVAVNDRLPTLRRLTTPCAACAPRAATATEGHVEGRSRDSTRHAILMAVRRVSLV